MTPLLRDGRFFKIGINSLIQMDDILVYSINPIDFPIKGGLHVHIYFEKFHCMSKEKSLIFSYAMEVFDCLVEVYIVGTFYWELIFESYVDVMHRRHHNLKGLNLYPHEVV